VLGGPHLGGTRPGLTTIAMDDLIDVVTQNVSVDHLTEELSALSAIHRPPATPDFRAAAEHCLERLAAMGVEAELLSYPADGETQYWTLRMPEEWRLRVGRLEQLLPNGGRRTLCDARQAPLSIAERSAATPPGGITTELVDFDAHPDMPLAGRLVLTSGDMRRARERAVEGREAAGIVWYDETAQPGELQYVQWWWVGDERRCPGFVVSAEEGRRLRDALSRAPVPVWAEVDAEFRRGSVDVVTALFPGTTPEEVLLVAHLDHACPGANDNASGCVVALEAMRLVAELVRGGHLARPQRGVRVLLTQEIIGTIPAVASGVADRVRTALCLDMVGWRREEEPGLSVVRSAEAAGPYANRLAARVARYLEQRGGPPISMQPFSSGSDHYVLCDATVGIPCPLLMRWPDPAWHTSRDVPETLSEDSLRAAAVFTACYALAAANADARAVGTPSTLPKSGPSIPGAADRAPRWQAIYVRQFRGPVMLRHLQPHMSAAERKLFARMVRYPAEEGQDRHRGIDELITVLNWTDGERTAAESLALAEAELQRRLDTEAVLGLLDLLARRGYLSKTPAGAERAEGA